jgi:ArsR family metal-binding transcriptional regulator
VSEFLKNKLLPCREDSPHLNAGSFNTVLGGDEFYRDPPALTLRTQGKLITVHPQAIAINALKDEAEAEKILECLKQEIDETWDKRAEIEPSYDSAPKPKIFEILKRLPKTNCRECGETTCMVFATRLAEGVKGSEDYPSLNPEGKENLNEYLKGFNLEY